MTVAAVVLAASPESALADADGVAAVRRIADVAWSGGATPIVVVSFDPDGRVASALAGAPVTLAEPAPVAAGPVAQMRRGIDVASDEIRGTDAVFLWPAKLTWVGAETVTSLIEAHGVDRPTVLRPAYHGEPGWPVLVPLVHADRLAAAAAGASPDEIIEALAVAVPTTIVELGDPGSVFDRSTPSSELPPYEGPTEPAAPHTHEWGAAIADRPGADDEPLEGPALAPYGQAEDPAAG